MEKKNPLKLESCYIVLKLDFCNWVNLVDTLWYIYIFFYLFTFIFSDAENLHVLVSTRHLGCLTDGMTRPPHFPYPRVLTLPFFGPFFPQPAFKNTTRQLHSLFFFWYVGLIINVICGNLMVYQSIYEHHWSCTQDSQRQEVTRKKTQTPGRKTSVLQFDHAPHLELLQSLYQKCSTGWQLAVTGPTRFLPFLVGFVFPLRSSKCGAPPRWAPLNGRGTRKCVWPFYNVLKCRSPWWPDPGWFI